MALRPPPLRTTSTYDDDESFNKVALNLLTRHTGYTLSVREAITSTLEKPEDRVSFLENLNNRKGPPARISPNSSSLIDKIEKTFGKELRKMVQRQNVSLKRQVCDDLSLGAHSGGANSSRSTEAQPKRRKSRRFFADCDSAGLFRSRRVQNIDFRLVEAISQVQSLRLDGTSPIDSGPGGYEPPCK
jgi:hypothetical protein